MSTEDNKRVSWKPEDRKPLVKNYDDDERVVLFTYKNHRNEISVRRVIPSEIWWGATDQHPEKQWLLVALDLDKSELRAFAMKDIHGWHKQRV